MTLFDLFERIVVINLPARRDRHDAMLVELACAGVRANDPRLQFFAAIRPDDAGDFPSIGARGCFLSHRAVIAAALKDGVRNVLILEDDLQLGESVCRAQPALVQTLAGTDWDFAYAGHIEALPGSLEAPHWQETTAALVCAHFYALNARILPALLAYLDQCLARPAGHPEGGPMHVDGAYSMFRKQQPQVTLIAAPSLGWQGSSRSDIYPYRWYDRFAPTRAAVALGRRVKNRLRR